MARLGDTVEDHYRYVDALLGEVVSASGGDRVLLVVSDHGFEAGPQGFRGRKKLLGTHQSQAAAVGVFAAAGGPLRQGVSLPAVSILDVAPTVLRLLDLPIAENLPGRVLTEALDPDWLSRHPERRVASYPGPPFDLPDADSGSTSPADEAVLEELRSLGYIE